MLRVDETEKQLTGQRGTRACLPHSTLPLPLLQAGPLPGIMIPAAPGERPTPALR